MLSLDATVGGEFSNSFCDQIFADDYFASHYSATKATLWAGFSDDQKSQLLILAASMLNAARFTAPTEIGFNPLGITPNYQLKQDSVTGKFHYVAVVTTEPVRYYYYQRLQFPRNLDIHTDGTVYVPDDIKIAQCEQAVYMATLDESALEAQQQGVTVDSLTLGNNQLSSHRKFDGSGRPFAPLAIQYAAQYLLKYTFRMPRS